MCLAVRDLAVIRLVGEFQSHNQVDVLNIGLIFLMSQFRYDLILFLGHEFRHHVVGIVGRRDGEELDVSGIAQSQ